MSRRLILAILAACAVLAVLAIVFWRSRPATSGAAGPAESASPHASTRPAPAAAPAPSSAARSVAVEIAPAAPTDRPEDPPTIAEPTERPALEAKFPLEILVVDAQDQPVFDAEIRLDGMRSKTNPGAWYPFRGGPSVARTDPRRRAVHDVWRWVDIDGRTNRVDSRITHADFVPFRDFSCATEPGVHEVVLQRGAVVSVRAWHGSPGAIVEVVQISLQHDAGLDMTAWTRESDGRLVTTRLAPGRHMMRVSHRPEGDGEPLYSAIELFEVRANERVDLSIELFAALEWTGILADPAPRHAVDGRVQPSLVETFAEHSGRTGIVAQFETEVRPDGSRVIRDVPRGTGYVFALCRGFVSSRTRAATLADAGITLLPGTTPGDEQRAWQLVGDDADELQRAEIPAPSPFTIAMVATGSLEITVTRADGTPIAYAEAAAYPNVQVPQYRSSLVPWREWSIATDSTGSVRFDDLPPDDSLWLGASADEFQMTAAERADFPSVVVRSGESTRCTIALEPANDRGGAVAAIQCDWNAACDAEPPDRR